MTSTQKLKKWSKILYEESDYADNYIDEATFLKLKKINGIKN